MATDQLKYAQVIEDVLLCVKLLKFFHYLYATQKDKHVNMQIVKTRSPEN